MANWPEGGISMLNTTLRKLAIFATIALACVGLAACVKEDANDGTIANNDAMTPVVITAEDKEKTEATKTTTTTTVAVTTTAEPTTTTEANETSAPEIEPTTTTTAEANETSEPEITTTEVPEETGIVTMADNPEGMYPMEECFRRKVEEVSGQSVVKIVVPKYAVVEDGRKYFLAPNGARLGDITNIEDYILSTDEKVDGYEGIIWYAPNAIE